MNNSFSAFTIRLPGNAEEITTDVTIYESLGKQPTFKERCASYKAVWDTGATGSVISKKVVKELQLQPVGRTRVIQVKDEDHSDLHQVHILLPNHLIFPNIQATVGDDFGCDLLIGMDIIRQGNFSISFDLLNMVFSFCVPPMIPIDFVQYLNIMRDEQESQKFQNVNLNDLCPCGSGKTFKKCHGRNIK